MRKFILLLLFPIVLYAATGDILSVDINTQGWFAEIKIEGLSTGGTHDYGLTGNDPSTATIIFTITSNGYTFITSETYRYPRLSPWQSTFTRFKHTLFK